MSGWFGSTQGEECMTEIKFWQEQKKK